jgi:signal transduction histidine kinase
LSVSYLLVALAAVVVVESLAIGIVLPESIGRQDLAHRAQVTAYQIAQEAYAANQSSDPATLELPAGFQVGELVSGYKPGSVAYQGDGIQIPEMNSASEANSPAAVIVDGAGVIVASSWPARFPIGERASSLLPAEALSPGANGAVTTVGDEIWSSVPLVSKQALRGGTEDPARLGRSLGLVFVEAPDAIPGGFQATILVPAIVSGLGLLVVSIPIAVLFGILTSRRTVSRLQRLAAASASLATGDLGHRVAVGPADEVGLLERQLNLMAERLAEARDAEKVRIESDSRDAERNRIARELHDAVSQNLFSIGMLAGGLERALPASSPLKEQASALRAAADESVKEMNELLLELRPSLLEQAGLRAAIDQVADAYRSRLHIDVSTDLHDVGLVPEREHAALRVAQEAMANAVRHSKARRISVRLSQAEGLVQLGVDDDGAGFERNGREPGMGLGMMQQRVEAVGGTLAVATSLGQGTKVTASFPVDGG